MTQIKQIFTDDKNEILLISACADLQSVHPVCVVDTPITNQRERSLLK
jgi:hypothetical protein